MEKFFYVARNNLGEKVQGTIDAAGQDEALGQLQAKELIVLSVVVTAKDSPHEFNAAAATKMPFKVKHYGISNDDLVLFCRQLATLLGAGVTILKSLDIIALQVSSHKLQNVIKDTQRDMEAGLSLHEAMGKHPAVFSDLWVNLVESGEASGNLAMVLGRLAVYLERVAAFKKKVISALIYPAILFVAGTGALLFLTVKIIPTFAELFKGFNVKMPPLTQALIIISIFLRKFGVAIFILIIVGGFLLRRALQTKTGRLALEQIEFRLPVFGEFFRSLVVERFSSEMSTLVESGVPLLYSLDISEHSVSNLTMAGIIRTIKEEVREGKPLNRSIEASGFFEPLVIQMVAIGEEIGELSQMFKKINTFYQEYIETFLGRFTTMFEPFMLIFFGLVIGVMVIGMFLPIFQIAQVGGG